MSDIAAAIAEARAFLRDNPDQARYTDSVATASIESGLRVRITGASGEQAWTDMPAGVGGSQSAPSPGWLLRAATAACVASLMAMRAAELGISLEGMTVAVDSESDDRGILAIVDDVPAGPIASRIVVRIPPGADADAFAAISRWALEHCPVSDAVRRAVPTELVVATGA